MTFFVTVMAGSLHGLLGVLAPGLLVLRPAEVAAHPRAGHDQRLTAACRRVEHAVRRLVAPGGEPVAAAAATGPQPTPGPYAERAPARLHGLDTALADLAGPLHARPRAAVPAFAA
jgi:hypothetical protein